VQPVNPLPIPEDLPFESLFPFRTDQLPLLLPFGQPLPDLSSIIQPYVPPLAIPTHFANLPDPRVSCTCQHELSDVIIIALCAVISGADSWYEIAAFGRAKKAWLAGFLKLPNGIPSHDTFNRVFSALDPVAFQDCFTNWVNAICDKLGYQFLRIDGKSLRGSADAGKGLGCLHTVSIWASDNGIVLGQAAVDHKSNEITAIPKLLEVLDLKGAIVTIDAMGCQKEIARLIKKQGGDYLLALKENQKTLYKDVVACFDKALEEGFAGLRYQVYHTQEKGHGRDEDRVYTVIYDPPGLSTQGEWEGLKAIVLVSRERVAGEHYSLEPHYYIASCSELAKVFATGIRGHWSIENGVHWVLDVAFGEDACRTRTGNAAENLAWLRRVALAILKQDPSPGSIKGKRKRAGWDTAFLAHLLGLTSDL
jgi:predicted transposase YbfD/YdcC